MAAHAHNPVRLLRALLATIEKDIIPLTAQGVSSGSKVFGAAILSRATLQPLAVATNDERLSPLLHGEINCIQRFFTTLDDASRPSTKDCIFLATHEPCSLCLSGITWAGFDNFHYLFTYEDSRDLFTIPYDIQILEEVFRVPAEGESGEQLARRDLYNRRNAFFASVCLKDLLDDIRDDVQREGWAAEVDRVKRLYVVLSDTYQRNKQMGTRTASFWR
ncbi:cytidine deoxycytidylate deaminase family protein [Polyplosphaeria fusca]|uniref:Cytidine deoxycytidylate deaminase family protein n=1 Tax=Polyplosphaeria fusca TaxID=682080 RepID=A0A9P4UWI1_9PLEO|nr:cytidine deoxycytidylate deaminase family protein [Polyplosphaeria fusca]